MKRELLTGMSGTGYDRGAFYMMAQERARHEQSLAGLLTADTSHKGKIDDIVAARVLMEYRDDLPLLLARANVSVESLMSKGKEWITAFLRDIPLLAVRMALAGQLLKNGSRAWSDNDSYDIDALGAAVPYCDVVVTENFAHHVLTKSGIAARLNTRVLRSLSELGDLLTRLVPNS